MRHKAWASLKSAKSIDRGTLSILSLFFAFSLMTGACTTSATQDESELGDGDASAEVVEEEGETDAVPEEGDAELSQAEKQPEAEVVEPESQPVADAAAPVSEPEPMQTPQEPVPAAVAEAPTAFESYTVATGDTLMKIAFQRYGDVFQWRKIASDNADTLKDPNVLPVGIQLKVEPSSTSIASGEGERYVIKKGDTLGTISGEVYGTQKKWRRLWDQNKELIKDPNRIFAGFYLHYLFTDQDRIEKESYSGKPSNALSGTAGTPSGRTPASTGK